MDYFLTAIASVSWYTLTFFAGIAVGFLLAEFLRWLAGDDPRYQEIHPEYAEYLRLKASGRLRLHIDDATSRTR